MAVDEDGNHVSRRVRPLTYALMSFIKVTLSLPDTIDISEDEMRAEWQLEVPVDPDQEEGEEGEDALSVIIRTLEGPGFIILIVNLGAYELDEEQVARVNEHILSVNPRLPVGNFQIINDSVIRYHYGIDVSGIASEDPNYHGPHLVQPKLIENMYRFGLAASRRFYGELPDLLGG
jgi:hypothetical protein